MLLFLPKRSSAERWGVKSTIIAFYSDVWDPPLRSRMTNALLFFLLLSHCVTGSLSQRGAPKLLLVTTTLNISIVSKALLFLPKRSSAERWGVKSTIIAFYSDVWDPPLRSRMTNALFFFLLLSHYVTAPLRTRSTQVSFCDYIVEYQQCKQRSSFQRGAPRSGEELSQQ